MSAVYRQVEVEAVTVHVSWLGDTIVMFHHELSSQSSPDSKRAGGFPTYRAPGRDGHLLPHLQRREIVGIIFSVSQRLSKAVEL